MRVARSLRIASLKPFVFVETVRRRWNRSSPSLMPFVTLRSFITFVRYVCSLRSFVETDDALDTASVWTQRLLGLMKSDETTALVAARSMLSLRG